MRGGGGHKEEMGHEGGDVWHEGEVGTAYFGLGPKENDMREPNTDQMARPPSSHDTAMAISSVCDQDMMDTAPRLS